MGLKVTMETQTTMDHKNLYVAGWEVPGTKRTQYIGESGSGAFWDHVGWCCWCWCWAGLLRGQFSWRRSLIQCWQPPLITGIKCFLDSKLHVCRSMFPWSLQTLELFCSPSSPLRLFTASLRSLPVCYCVSLNLSQDAISTDSISKQLRKGPCSSHRDRN